MTLIYNLTYINHSFGVLGIEHEDEKDEEEKKPVEKKAANLTSPINALGCKYLIRNCDDSFKFMENSISNIMMIITYIV